MKNLLIVLFFVAGAFASFGQKSIKGNPDSELSKVYSSAELESMKKDSPENYQALVYGLENAISVESIKFGSKDINLETKEVDLDNIPSFAELGIKISNQNQYFKIANSDKILMVKSFYLLKNKF